MAYYLTGSKAHWHNQRRTLKPLRLDQGLTRVCETRTIFEDSCGRAVALPTGHTYRITGTRDGNGYVVTFDDVDKVAGTRYLTAEQGCKLV